MVIKFSQTDKIVDPNAAIWDYPMPNDGLGLAYQVQTSPHKLEYCNTICHEIYYIIEGSGTVFINGKPHPVGAKDTIIIEPNTRHRMETKYMKFITITRPDWYEKQCKTRKI